MMIPFFWAQGVVLAILAAFRIWFAVQLIDSVIEWR
jgi:hypothetical protein